MVRYADCIKLKCIKRNLTSKRLVQERVWKSKACQFQSKSCSQVQNASHGMLTLLAHKLQDFKIKFQGEKQQVTSQLCNKSQTLTFQHILEQRDQSNYKNSRLQQYFEIISNASTLQEIIRSLISKEAMKILHGFKSIQAVEYEGGNSRIPFPILQVKMNPLMAKQ